MKRKKENQKALPTGWREVKLGEVCSIDKRALSSQTPHDYCFDYISLSDIERGRLLKTQKCKYSEAPSRARRIVAKGDVLLATVRPYLQGFYIFRNHVKDCIVSTGFAVLSPKSNLLNSSYLYEILFSQYMMATYHAFNVGSNYPAVNSSDIRKFKIPLPPLPEQKAIASLLETWDTAIEKTEALIAAKEKRFKWLLKTLIHDQQNNPEWRKVKLGEIANLYQPKTIPKKDMRRNGQYKVFGANGVIGYYHKYNHEEAEIAVVCRGATCGRVNMTEPKSWITGNAMVVKPDKGCVKKSYLYYFLSGASLTACISGAAQPQITRQDLFHFQTIISTNSEQKQIATTLETAEREIELQKRLTEQCRRQKHGLMQKLLTGEWRLIPSFPRKCK